MAAAGTDPGADRKKEPNGDPAGTDSPEQAGCALQSGPLLQSALAWAVGPGSAARGFRAGAGTFEGGCQQSSLREALPSTSPTSSQHGGRQAGTLGASR